MDRYIFRCYVGNEGGELSVQIILQVEEEAGRCVELVKHGSEVELTSLLLNVRHKILTEFCRHTFVLPMSIPITE